MAEQLVRLRKTKWNTRAFGLWLALGLLIFNLNPVPGSRAAGQDGTLDLTFKTGAGPTSYITGLAQQSDGKLLVGGSFTSYDNVVRGGIVRLNSVGNLDNTFNSAGVGADNSVDVIVPQNDGKILIGGAFDNYNGAARPSLARLNADGTLDTTFAQAGLGGSVYTIVLQSDGKILIGGSFLHVGGVLRRCIARLNADGTLDTTFDPGAGAVNINNTGCAVYAINIQGSGKLVIGGKFIKFNNLPANRIVRLNPDGSVDTSFNSGTGASQTIRRLIPQASGKMLVGGTFTTYNDMTVNNFTRLNEDGSLDSSFNSGSGLSGTFQTMVVQNDSKILLGGAFFSYNNTPVKNIVRLNADGSLDSSFNPGSGPDTYVLALLLQADNKILIGGSFTSYDNQGRNFLAQLNPDGSFVPSFGQLNGANHIVREVVVQPDGKILVGGVFTYYAGLLRQGIVRLNADGTPDTTFNPGTGVPNAVQYVSGVYKIKVQSDGKILIGGNFVGYNGTQVNNIARLNSDGSLDSSFNTGSGTNGAVFALTLQPDGKILIGGNFDSYNGTAVNGIARLNSDGSLDNSFRSPDWANQDVQIILVQPDGKILMGGFLNTTHVAPEVGNFARLNSDGSLDTTFNNAGRGANYSVSTGLLQPDGKILIGGFFTTYNGNPIGRLARLNSDGTLDTTFNTGSGASREIFSMALQPNNQILIAGFIEKYNGITVNSIARLNPDGSLDTAFNQDSKVDNLIYSIALQTDNKILIGGLFRTVANFTRDFIARLENTACNPQVVTNSGDDGQATNCGTFSYALVNAPAGTTVTFALSDSNTVTFNGSLNPTLKPGVNLDGGANGIVLDGKQVSGDGLRLGGNNTLSNLTIRGFSGRALVANSPDNQNWLYRVKIEK